MIMNSLCALALGYVLDMAFGDPGGMLYPPNIVKALVVKLEDTLRKAYADYAEAKTMAGIMLIVLILVICFGAAAGLLAVAYKLGVVLGIIVEGVLCWYALSIRAVRTNLKGVVRAAKTGNIATVRRYLKKLTGCDVDELDTEQAVKCAVEASAESITEKILSPIFWICILGGAGGFLYKCVNIIAEEVGHPTENYRYFGSVPARLNYALNFVPARLAALLMRVNAAFLKLDSRKGWEVRRDCGGFKAENSLQTIAFAAGALGLQLGGRESIRGEAVDKPVVGEAVHPPHGEDAFWMNQLATGVSAYGLILAAIVKTLAFLIFR